MAGCYCGSGKAYAQCCELWHSGAVAPTAEALMRSRYSAYVLGLHDYIKATWHASTYPGDAEPDAGTRWLGLQVKRFELLDANHAWVEFVARYKVAGRAHRLHELSRFVLEQGRWWYVDGDILS